MRLSGLFIAVPIVVGWSVVHLGRAKVCFSREVLSGMEVCGYLGGVHALQFYGVVIHQVRLIIYHVSTYTNSFIQTQGVFGGVYRRHVRPTNGQVQSRGGQGSEAVRSVCPRHLAGFILKRFVSIGVAIRGLLTNFYRDFWRDFPTRVGVLLKVFQGFKFFGNSLVNPSLYFLLSSVSVSSGLTVLPSQRVGQYGFLSMGDLRIFRCLAMAYVIGVRVYRRSRAQGVVFFASFPNASYSYLGPHFSKGGSGYYVHYKGYLFSFPSGVGVT